MARKAAPSPESEPTAPAGPDPATEPAPAGREPEPTDQAAPETAPEPEPAPALRSEAPAQPVPAPAEPAPTTATLMPCNNGLTETSGPMRELLLDACERYGVDPTTEKRPRELWVTALSLLNSMPLPSSLLSQLQVPSPSLLKTFRCRQVNSIEFVL